MKQRVPWALLFILFTVFAIPHLALASTVLDHSNTSSLSQGLVGYWPLDGATTNWLTGTTQDVSGNNNTGTLVGMSTTTSPTAGKVGQALKFNGGYIDTGKVIIPDNTTFTVSAWIKTPLSIDETIVSRDVDINNKRWRVTALANGKVEVADVNTLGTYQLDDTVAAPITANTWHHIVAVFNYSSHIATVYVDGVNYPLNSNVLSNPSNTAGSPSLRVGISRSTPFSGTIDDVRLYNRVLSSQEVSQLYFQGTANVAHSNPVSLSSGLVGYWTLDGSATNWNTGKTSDSSGNGNTGSLISMSTTTSPTAGKVGQGLSTGASAAGGD